MLESKLMHRRKSRISMSWLSSVRFSSLPCPISTSRNYRNRLKIAFTRASGGSLLKVALMLALKLSNEIVASQKVGLRKLTHA